MWDKSRFYAFSSPSTDTKNHNLFKLRHLCGMAEEEGFELSPIVGYT